MLLHYTIRSTRQKICTSRCEEVLSHCFSFYEFAEASGKSSVPTAQSPLPPFTQGGHGWCARRYSVHSNRQTTIYLYAESADMHFLFSPSYQRKPLFAILFTPENIRCIPFCRNRRILRRWGNRGRSVCPGGCLPGLGRCRRKRSRRRRRCRAGCPG